MKLNVLVIGKYVLIRFEYDLILYTLYLFTKMITNLLKKREERNIFGDNVRRKKDIRIYLNLLRIIWSLQFLFLILQKVKPSRIKMGVCNGCLNVCQRNHEYLNSLSVLLAESAATL